MSIMSLILPKSLIIFEFIDEVEAFIAQKSIDALKDKNNYIIAVWPKVRAYLKKINVSCCGTYNFFGKEGQQKVLLKSDSIYQLFRSDLNIKDDLGSKHGYSVSFLYHLREYTHYVLWLIEIIDTAHTQFNFGKIIICDMEYSHLKNNSFFFNAGYCNEVIKRVADNYGIACEIIHKRNNKKLFFAVSLKAYLEKIVNLILYYQGMKRIKHKARNRKYAIFAPYKNHNIDKVLEKFKSEFDSVQIYYLDLGGKESLKTSFFNNNGPIHIPLPKISGRKRQKKFLKRLSDTISKLELSNSNNNYYFSYKEVNFKDMIFNKIRKNILPAMCDIHTQSTYLDKLLKQKRPTIIISNTSGGVFSILGDLSSLYGIPSLMIPQGSHVPPKNEYEMIEWKEHGLCLMNTPYRYLAVQSPWARAYLEKVPTKSKQIITGPLLFTSIENNKNRKTLLREKIIPEHKDDVILVHASTPKGRSMRLYVYERPDEYIENINSLIRAVETIENMHLIIRMRPLNYMKMFMLTEDVRDLLIQSDCYSIHSEGSFEDYLSIADMIVSYSSTTIEEALQNKVPVLQYDSQGKYCHIEGQVLDPSLNPSVDSCYYVDTNGKLSWALRWLLENHFQKELPDSIWERHVFRDSEKIKLTDYFSELFKDGKKIGFDS